MAKGRMKPGGPARAAASAVLFPHLVGKDTFTATSLATFSRTVGGLVLLLIGLSSTWAQTPEPFACSPDGILFQYPGNNPPTQVQRVDMVTGDFVTDMNLADRRINAIGYNVIDDFIYGWDFDSNGSNNLVQVGSNGVVNDLTIPGGVPGSGRLVGDIDDNGHYWLTGGGGSGTWVQINLTVDPPEVLASGPIEGGGIGDFTSGPDWAYVPGGGDYLYRIMARDGESWLFRFSRTTQQHENLGSLGTLDNNVFGAVYADPDGFLYISNNDTGNIYRIDVHNITATFFSAGPSSGFNDGSRCFHAPIPIDFGDAPEVYETLLVSGGARHNVPNFNAAENTAPLMLGQSVDIEFDGSPSPAGDGDDITGVDDEDGVTAPIAIVAGQPVDVDVFVTNETDQPATLAGWIDLDGSESFDASERAPLATVLPGFSGERTLSFPGGTAVADTYARFRVFPGDVADPGPASGPAAAGEVEDYPVATGHVHFQKSIDPDDADSLEPGDTFTYTVTASNIGSVLLTGLSFVDDLSGVVDDATYNNDVTVSGGPGTAMFNSPDEIVWNGDLDVGQTATIMYSVTIDDPIGGDSTILNGVVGSGPGSNCPSPGPSSDPDCFSRVPQPQLETMKTSSPAGTVQPGDTVNYEFTIGNAGTAEADDVAVVDLLSNVLDDATYNGDAMADDGAVTFDAATERLIWSGTVPVDGLITVNYSVTVNSTDAMGDGVLDNALLSPDCPDPPVFDPGASGYDADCVTRTPVEAWTVAKTSEPDDAVVPGADVTYTLVVENTGGADLIGLSVADDLADVIDDASYNGDAVVTGPGMVAFNAPDEIVWTGGLDIGETATITYSVTVNSVGMLGNQMLVNAVSGPPNCPDPPVTNPGDPAFDPDCVVIGPVETWEAVKASDAVDPVEPGDVINYEVAITNTGTTDLINVGLTVIDDLTEVLDDATYNTDADATFGTVSYSAPELSWEGDLPSGDSAVITYSVTVNEPATGDGVLTNTILGAPNCPEPPVTDPDDPDFNPDCVLNIPTGPAVSMDKVLTGESGSIDGQAEPGEALTYAITLANAGGSDAENYSVTDLLDSNVIFVSADNGGAHDGSTVGGEIDWSGLGIPAGGDLTLVVVAEVVDPIPLGVAEIENVAYETGTDVPDCDVDPPPPNCTTIRQDIVSVPIDSFRVLVLLVLVLVAAGLHAAWRRG